MTILFTLLSTKTEALSNVLSQVFDSAESHFCKNSNAAFKQQNIHMVLLHASKAFQSIFEKFSLYANKNMEQEATYSNNAIFSNLSAFHELTVQNKCSERMYFSTKTSKDGRVLYKYFVEDIKTGKILLVNESKVWDKNTMRDEVAGLKKTPITLDDDIITSPEELKGYSVPRPVCISLDTVIKLLQDSTDSSCRNISSITGEFH
jgi:DNA-directed RNA polymerase